ncbi:hypothetical protein BRYFOR_05872 [Marvinbryantia formatexigens DSM 14469]|uniref:Uncharacterized protein n=1 Tax=Marvinbryantia formatexigens DSM 14469 TaxID=478749 RepID=C6LB77_9FIRM|nr:hypothetical protein [Marvinbryantia formatexigens]EET62208.1 hypothetical protein BRYFOR_05872 [Marvinbryantia formatexigens DSM 14469]UWO26459.1 hypothetical protein NQ534_08395 [Marvinbryantia formatexigens DSM 14469]SDF79959.1 hypothetical protein SAMN05660368_01345 [Marvinbryantia formatexigens]
MRSNKKQYDDDDGRIIADMSALSPGGGRKRFASPEKEQEESGREERPWEDTFTKEERRMYTLGALKAALLIAMVFIIGLGLVTAFLLFLWS